MMAWALAGLLIGPLAGFGTTGETARASTIAGVTGDGRLTVAVDTSGHISDMRWPSPGQWEHARVGPGGHNDVVTAGATGWRLYDGNGWTEFTPDRWQIRTGYTASDSLVLITRYEEHGGERSALQRVFVWPGRDAFVVQLHLEGFDPETRIAWYQNLAPSTAVSVIPRVRGASRDFAAWYSTDTDLLTHFRPSAPGRKEWAAARTLVHTRAGATGWNKFGEGAYFCTVSPNAVRNAEVGEEIVPLPGSGGASACGTVHAWMELSPETQGGGLVATVFVAAADTASAAAVAAGAARDAGGATLLAAAEAVGREWLQGAGDRPEAIGLERDILNLLLCVDRDTGMVLRAPAGHSTGDYATVFHTVWAAAALDELGYTDAAARALQVHLDTIRSGDTGGFPSGSLPAHITVDGRPARFSEAADPATAAWLIAACWRHATVLPASRARDYLEGVWPRLAESADFLALAPVVEPHPVGEGRPRVGTTELRATTYLGLECARRIAEMLGREETDAVLDRRSDLYSRIRSRRLNGEPEHELGYPWISHWLAELGRDMPRAENWDVLLDGTSDDLGGHPELSEIGNDVAPELPSAGRDALKCLAGLRRAVERNRLPAPQARLSLESAPDY